jgi:pyruvate formate lyase activating enzyme
VSVAEAAFPDSMSAGQVASLAATTENNIGIAYTYNEPTIWFEYVIEVAQQVKSFGLKNVMVTNGFINPEPLAELMEFIDAFSIDLKSFDESFYRKQTASALPPVLDTLKTVKKAGKHLEVVNLVIPNLNDDPENFKDMIQWIASELGRETVLHLSAYYPCYRAKEPPTPAGLLLQFRDIASAFLDFVYTGNLPGENNNTICPVCGSILIERRGYLTAVQGLTTEGACKSCGRKIFQKN